MSLIIDFLLIDCYLNMLSCIRVGGERHFYCLIKCC